MASGVKWILLHEGPPVAAVFGDTRGQGTPIVIDYTADMAYYLHPNGEVRPLGGSGSGLQNYQLSCSDLGSDIVATPDAGYFRTQTPISFYRVRASLLYAPVGGTLAIQIRNRETEEIIVDNLEIIAGDFTAETSELLITDFEDNTIITVDIVDGGVGAKGLVVAMVGKVID